MGRPEHGLAKHFTPTLRRLRLIDSLGASMSSLRLLWGGSASVAVRTVVSCGGPAADPFDATLFIRSRSEERDPLTLLGVTIRRLERSRETSVFIFFWALPGLTRDFSLVD